MEPLLHTEDLSRAFNGRYVVDGLDLSLQRGDILGLLGPNGAGKSTALRMLCGDLAPSRGSIRICGHELQVEPLAAKRQLGYLPERPPLHPDQRVDEYLLDVARLRRIANSRQREVVAQVKRRCGLQAVGRRLIWNLSKGFQQRVGIAQAILHHPMVMVLDEPTDGLDPTQIREVRALIRMLAETAGVILSSHLLPQIQALCNRVVILQAGRSVYQDAITPPTRNRWMIQLAHAVEPDALTGLPLVAAAEALPGSLYRLDLLPEADVAQLAERIVERGWGLRRLTPQAPDLEQLYVQATSGEGAA